MVRIEKEEFVEIFRSMTDFERFEFLIESEYIFPEFKIFIDNDSVFIAFVEDQYLEDPIILEFDEYGYNLLNEVLNVNGLKSELV